jgi:hypothetical protein
MTSERIGFLMGLLGVGLCAACGSSTGLSAETDADVTWVATGGTGGTGESTGGGASTSTGGAGGEDSSSDDPDQKIKSGSVAMDKFIGPATSSCQQLSRLNNPAQSLTGYVQMGPSAYLNSPKANEESYLYLESGKNAVILPGPNVSYGASSVDFSAAQLTTCVKEESACLNQDGYRVKVNERLSYVITIEDWEEEVALGQVQLCLNKGSLTTEFVFAGLGYYLGGGVAHQLTIIPILDGTRGTPTTPVTIECRSQTY